MRANITNPPVKKFFSFFLKQKTKYKTLFKIKINQDNYNLLKKFNKFKIKSCFNLF